MSLNDCSRQKFAQHINHCSFTSQLLTTAMADTFKTRVNSAMLPSFQGKDVCVLGMAKDVSSSCREMSHIFAMLQI